MTRIRRVGKVDFAQRSKDHFNKVVQIGLLEQKDNFELKNLVISTKKNKVPDEINWLVVIDSFVIVTQGALVCPYSSTKAAVIGLSVVSIIKETVSIPVDEEKVVTTKDSVQDDNDVVLGVVLVSNVDYVTTAIEMLDKVGTIIDEGTVKEEKIKDVTV